MSSCSGPNGDALAGKLGKAWEGQRSMNMADKPTASLTYDGRAGKQREKNGARLTDAYAILRPRRE